MRVPFTKLQALRNDFVLVDGRTVPVPDPPSLARALCDRKSGIGADTLLLLLPSEQADLLVRIFNPDGSEGELSGNGTRSAAAFLLARGGKERTTATIETVSGVSTHHLEKKSGKRSFLASRIVAPRFRPAEIPVLIDGEEAVDVPVRLSAETVRVTCVNIGNPQAVVFEGWDESNWMRLGREIENHAIFPQRTNVDFARVVSRDRLRTTLWERGVGPVESSGTGASGAFAAARRLGFVDPRVRVDMEGGALEIEEAEAALLLRGWCEEVFEGSIETEAGRRDE
ncbi:MAG: diaminopimelate epimerase [Candidatus Eisenbacteria bacterium]